MRKIACVLNITGWVLTIRTLWLLIAGSAGVSAIVTGIVYLFSHLPTWLLIIFLICLTIMLFFGFGYLLDAIKKKIQSRVMPSGLVFNANTFNITNNFIFEVKPEDMHGRGFRKEGESTEIVDSSGDAEKE